MKNTRAQEDLQTSQRPHKAPRSSDPSISDSARTASEPRGSKVTVAKENLTRFLKGLRENYTGPLADAHLILTICVILSVIGVVMVLDSSGPTAYRTTGNYYSTFLRQILFMLVGWVGFYCALRISVDKLRKWSFPFYLVCLVLLVLVLIPGIGVERNGARSWFDFGPVAFQPSEIAKIGVIVVVAVALGQLTAFSTVKDLLWPLSLFIPVIVLVALQRDLGMATTFAVVFIAFLVFGRAPGRLIGWLSVLFLLLAIILTVTQGFRTDRLVTYWHQLLGQDYDVQDVGYQAWQARLALADGGFWGVGLGQSRAKYFYLPEASNDFIFAIIGEELGLIGCIVIIALYATLAIVGYRVARRVTDPALRLLAATGVTSIVTQAFINIGYVSGLLPVTGLQLPLISAGGSATVSSLILLGLITNAARHENPAIAAISTGGDKLGRFLRLPTPEVYRIDDTPDFGIFTPLFQRLAGAGDVGRAATPQAPGASGIYSHSHASNKGLRRDSRGGKDDLGPLRGSRASSHSRSATSGRGAETSRSKGTSHGHTLPPLERPVGRRMSPPPRGYQAPPPRSGNAPAPPRRRERPHHPWED